MPLITAPGLSLQTSLDSLPPLGFPFRLFSLTANRVFTASDDGLTLVDSAVDSDEQYFVLLDDSRGAIAEASRSDLGNREKGSKSNTYLIKNLRTGKVFHMGKDAKINLVDPQPGSSSQRFMFRPRSWKSVAAFSLQSYASGGPSVSDLTASESAVIPIPGAVDVVDVVYYIRAGRLSLTSPQVLTSQTVTNDSPVIKTLEADLITSVTVIHSFTHISGPPLAVGSSFKTGIPEVAEGEIKPEVGRKQDFTWGQVKTVTVSVGQRVPVKCPPFSKLRITGWVKCSRIEIPCIMRLRSKVKPDLTTETRLLYHGLSYWDFNTTCEELA
ncbi:hypothetical protein VTO42DRAFT_8232 [Malbranchea cinnamomea]